MAEPHDLNEDDLSQVTGGSGTPMVDPKSGPGQFDPGNFSTGDLTSHLARIMLEQAGQQRDAARQDRAAARAAEVDAMRDAAEHMKAASQTAMQSAVVSAQLGAVSGSAFAIVSAAGMGGLKTPKGEIGADVGSSKAQLVGKGPK